MDHGEETLSQPFWDSMSWFAAFGRNWLSIFAKPVHEYRRVLPNRARLEENNRIAARVELFTESARTMRAYRAKATSRLSTSQAEIVRETFGNASHVIVSYRVGRITIKSED